MTVLCVNSGITYADIVAADAAEGGASYGVPTRYEQSGTSTGNITFRGIDYPDSFIYTAAIGEESTGGIGVGAKCDGNITTTVTDCAITNLNTGVINVVNANSAYLRKLVVDAGGGTIDGVVFNDTTDAEDILVHNCNDGFLSSALVNNSLIKKCTVIGATRFGFAQGKFTDCVDVNSLNQGYFNEAGASSGTWEHDGTGTNTIAESPATDIFEDFDGGDYRIKSTSSPGLAGAGAFINSGGGNDVILAIDSLSNLNTLSESSLTTQSTVFAVDSLASTQALSESTLTQNHTIPIDNIVNLQSLSQPTFTQASVLSVNSLSNGQTLSDVALSVAGALSVNPISNDNNVSNVTFTSSGALSVNNLDNNQPLSAAEFVQGHLLSTENIINTHSISLPDINTGTNFIVQDISSAQNITTSGMTQHNIILVDPITNAQLIGVVNIGGDGQDVGKITAAFKESGISVKYGTINLTVKFKE